MHACTSGLGKRAAILSATAFVALPTAFAKQLLVLLRRQVFVQLVERAEMNLAAFEIPRSRPRREP